MINRTREQKEAYIIALRLKMRDYMKSNDIKRIQEIKQQIAKTIGTVIVTF